MAYEKREGDIAIYYNDPADKKNPQAPDWTGEALIDGQVRRVALWSKSPTMLAGNVQLKQTQYAASTSGAATPATPDPYAPNPSTPSYEASQNPEDDEIPF